MPEKTDLRKKIDAFCEENYADEPVVLFGSAYGDTYDVGFVGVGRRINQVPIAIYDREVCIDALAEEFSKDSTYDDDEDSDPYTDAVEFWDFNTEGSWVGEETPIILSSFSSNTV